ncbi:MAG: aspartate ammonia-lyase [Oligoflexia bacterium]|nr:aspartate ammonia-lyase [Oligoflexia bacterium]MBF0366797.1 aspartate ammonia-lyase [Oligoflexia bacterium]
MKRVESDFIGSVEIDQHALYGINSFRARKNFPWARPFPLDWYRSVGLVKHVYYKTYEKFMKKIYEKYGSHKTLPFRVMAEKEVWALLQASWEVWQGEHFEHFIVPAISGGAGTSINMNVNEIIANRTLRILGRACGDYGIIDPLENCNIFQSTNDVVPTALRIAILLQLKNLEQEVQLLRQEIEAKEKEYRYTLRMGATEWQEAVPTTFGRLFSTYQEAFSRDWWRISKCFERLKVCNLGGSAIGTAVGVPRFFVFEAINFLQTFLPFPLARAENLQDATANLDALVESHAILKAYAVNIEKMASDLRLLSSDLYYEHTLKIAPCQLGSSIMPTKVNPVISEYAISLAHKIYANDQLITALCAQGSLDLNPYLPSIGVAFIESLEVLIAISRSLRENLIPTLVISKEKSDSNILLRPTIVTLVVPYIGHKKASVLAKEMKDKKVDIITANRTLNLIPEEKLQNILKSENILKLGFSVEEIL